MADLMIRRATEGDAAVLAELSARLAECPLPSWHTRDDVAAADWRAMMQAIRVPQPDNDVLLLERDTAAVGCLHVYAATDFFGRRHAHLSVIAVSAAAEGQGVGHLLLDHAETWARSRGLGLLTLHVRPENARARRFYERHDFVQELVRYAKLLG